MSWQDFLTFRRMVTPLIIQALFWIGVALSVLTGAAWLVTGLVVGINEDQASVLLISLCCSPVIVVLGILLSRIEAELLILAFRTYETLNDIRNLLTRR
ncbi:MAG: DUF4282 domain-containing protein [Anaerolineae bacterium]|nr:DUF4282 domain-containing protein [Anaerolineae bacterium]